MKIQHAWPFRPGRALQIENSETSTHKPLLLFSLQPQKRGEADFCSAGERSAPLNLYGKAAFDREVTAVTSVRATVS